MKISVKVADIKLVVNDSDSSSVLKYGSHSIEIQKTLVIMVDQCVRLHKERK